jgi:hypothetical protein
VSFTIRHDATAVRELFRAFAQLKLPYHDMMTFDRKDTGKPGVIRFDFAAPRELVDQTANWLRAQPTILSVRPFYGADSGAA